MNISFQVTIPDAGVVNLQTAIFGANPSFLESNAYVQWLVFQNNSAHPCRYGTSHLVSVTTPAAVNGGTAGLGTLLLPGGAGSQSTPITYSTMLSEWWIAGTPGDVIDGQCLQ
ncbi:MAG: hypothetical protein WA213_20730 [Terriglobales bacterium]